MNLKKQKALAKRIKFGKNKKVSIILVFIFLTIYSGVLIATGWLVYHLNLTPTISKIIRSNAQLPLHFVKSFTAQSDQIILDIKHEDWVVLEQKRQEALENGYLAADSEDYVSADLTYNQEKYLVKIRLKGDLLDHLKGTKWSFRVKTKDNTAINGLKEFSLQHPQVRGYLNEWIFYKLLAFNDLIHLKYSFVNLTINGKNYGTYALEEHFTKQLVERSGYREGPIIRFEEDSYWMYRSDPNIDYQTAYFLGDIDVFNSSKLSENPQQWQYFIQARNLLENFRYGQISVEQTFNIQALAKIMAISDFLGSNHLHEFHNIRFYYNPITTKLEPIAYDNEIIQKASIIYGSTKTDDRKERFSTWEKLLFEDQNFMALYLSFLDKFSSEAYLNEFLSLILPELERQQKIIWRDFPWYQLEAFDIITANQKLIKKYLRPPKSLIVYTNSIKTDSITFEIASINTLPLSLKQIKINGVSVDLSPEILIPAADNSLFPEFQSYTLSIKPACNPINQESKIELSYSVLNTDYNVTQTAFTHPRSVISTINLPVPNIYLFPFIHSQGDNLSIISGYHVITQDLVIPPHHTLYLFPGTTLDLKNSANIISYSPIVSQGTISNPIMIISSDSTGQGVVVINAAHESRFEYTTFTNLSNLSKPGWLLSGSVTFYQSPISITRSYFKNARAEDCLNIIRSGFNISDSYFFDSQSDTIDVDFGLGEINGVKITNSKNDCLDFSGSVVKINDSVLQNCQDKGISVGEASQATFKNSSVLNSVVGLASKDMSNLYLEDSTIQDCQIALAAYQKKEEFGPALIKSTNSKYTNNNLFYHIQNNSALIINSKYIAANQENGLE